MIVVFSTCYYILPSLLAASKRIVAFSRNSENTNTVTVLLSTPALQLFYKIFNLVLFYVQVVFTGRKIS